MTVDRNAGYWLALQLIFGPGSAYINEIADKFATAEEFFAAGEEGWNTIESILPLHLEQLAQPDFAAVDRIIRDCGHVGCRIVTPEDEAYPDALRHIYGMPAVLYVLGDLSCLKDHLAIAMVGTRNCSSTALNIADRMARELAHQKVVVVSGMALGIDAACHWGAVYGGGKTVAFLSCGLDQIYPQENSALWSRIQANGAVVSEYPPGTEITKHSFHHRNRLISGVSQGVVMVEGAAKSGTNITVTHGLEQGKEIFVIPWNIDTGAGRWAVQLLREGAIAVSNAAQILEEYGYNESSRLPESEEEREEKRERLRDTVKRVQKKSVRTEDTGTKTPEPKEEPEQPPEPEEPVELEGEHKRIYDSFGDGLQTVEDLAEKLGMDADEVSMLLTEMEVLGAVVVNEEKQYRKR